MTLPISNCRSDTLSADWMLKEFQDQKLTVSLASLKNITVAIDGLQRMKSLKIIRSSVVLLDLDQNIETL